MRLKQNVGALVPMLIATAVGLSLVTAPREASAAVVLCQSANGKHVTWRVTACKANETTLNVASQIGVLGSSVVTRDSPVLDLSTGTTATVFCEPGETAIGGSVNIIPDGSGAVTTSRPVGDTFLDSPDDGHPFIGWLGVSNSGSGSMVVHVFCAS